MELRDIQHQKAGIIIGKKGLSEGTISLIRETIKKQGIVKIKILKTALSPEYSIEMLIKDLITITEYHLVEKRGFSVIISQTSLKNKKNNPPG